MQINDAVVFLFSNDLLQGRVISINGASLIVEAPLYGDTSMLFNWPVDIKKNTVQKIGRYVKKKSGCFGPAGY